jgi:hypothetical protein
VADGLEPLLVAAEIPRAANGDGFMVRGYAFNHSVSRVTLDTNTHGKTRYEKWQLTVPMGP